LDLIAAGTSSAIYSAKKAIRKDGLFAIQILAFILIVVGQAIFITYIPTLD